MIIIIKLIIQIIVHICQEHRPQGLDAVIKIIVLEEVAKIIILEVVVTIIILDLFIKVIFIDVFIKIKSSRQ